MVPFLFYISVDVQIYLVIRPTNTLTFLTLLENMNNTISILHTIRDCSPEWVMCISIFVLHFLYIISDLSKNLTVAATYYRQTIPLSNVDPKISYDVCLGVILANNRTVYSTIQTVTVGLSGNSTFSFLENMIYLDF